jgi:hypothetical protein
MTATIQRRKLNYTNVDAVIADVQSLRKGYTQNGNWTLPQICWHLSTVIERTGHPATEPATPDQQKRRPMFEQILATGLLPAGRIDAPETVLPPANCDDAAIDAFLATLRKLAVYPEKTASHRLFGPMTADQYKRQSLIHCAHHLSHLTANS